jgi:pyrroline-5-carboxylate reductase
MPYKDRQLFSLLTINSKFFYTFLFLDALSSSAPGILKYVQSNPGGLPTGLLFYFRGMNHKTDFSGQQLSLSIIGCGNLGIAIANGLLAQGTAPSSIVASRRNVHPLQGLADQGVRITSNNAEAVKESRLVILAVKPYNVVPVLEEIRDLLTDEHMIVSVATGISIADMKAAIGKDLRLFRAMPNTAADVRESLTCVCGKGRHTDDLALIQSVFSGLGPTIVINEELMEAATVLGACGIAYVLRFMRAMVQGGIEIGFDARTATAIVNQVVKGASELLIVRKQHPEHEIDKVTTPKGCTIVGLNEMEHNGFSSSLIKGIVASYDKIAH